MSRLLGALAVAGALLLTSATGGTVSAQSDACWAATRFVEQLTAAGVAPSESTVRWWMAACGLAPTPQPVQPGFDLLVGGVPTHLQQARSSRSVTPRPSTWRRTSSSTSSPVGINTCALVARLT